jgi:hypothetical protein
MDDEKVGEKNAAVSAWLSAQGWLVTERHYNERRSMYLWRSSEYGAPTITLWITRNVFDDHTIHGLVRLLDRLRTHQYLQAAPEKYTIIKTSDIGEPELVQIEELPKTIIRSA